MYKKIENCGLNNYRGGLNIQVVLKTGFTVLVVHLQNVQTYVTMVVYVWMVTRCEKNDSWRRVGIVGWKGKREFITKTIVCSFRTSSNSSNPVKEVVSVRKCRHRRISSHLGQVIIIIMADTLILMLTMSVMRSCCSRLVTECPSLGPVWHVSCLLRAGRPLGTIFCAIFSFFLKRDLAFRFRNSKTNWVGGAVS